MRGGFLALLSFRVSLLLCLGLRLPADATAAYGACRGAPSSAFTGIVVSNLADQRAGSCATDGAPGTRSTPGVLGSFFVGLRLLLVSLLLFRQLKGIATGVANRPLVTCCFVLRLLGTVLALGRENVYLHRRRERLARTLRQRGEWENEASEYRGCYFHFRAPVRFSSGGYSSSVALNCVRG